MAYHNEDIARKRQKATLCQRRWLNRHLIWPRRKVNRLLAEHDAVMRLAVLKCRQWGASPKVWELAIRLYRQLKFKANYDKPNAKKISYEAEKTVHVSLIASF